MAKITGRSVMRWLGVALIAMSGVALLALVVYALSSGFDEVAMIMVAFFACLIALGLLMVRLSRRQPRVVKMGRGGEPAKPAPAATAAPAVEEPAKPAPIPAAAPAVEEPAKPAPAATVAPVPAPPEPEPFSEYERVDARTRTFKVRRDQMNLAERPELEAFDVPYDHRVAATIALALRDCGYEMRRLGIGGGSTEVSHTGAVEYGGTYDSLDDFIANAPADYQRAGDEAEEEYGTWFTGLNWFWIRFVCERAGSEVRVEISSICSAELTWESSDWNRFEDEVATVKRNLCGGAS